jgi:hypothetical protein
MESSTVASHQKTSLTTDVDHVYDNAKNACKIGNMSENLVQEPAKTEKKSTRAFFSNCHCFLSIWSVWYILFVIGLHVYLIHNYVINIVQLIKSYTSILNKLKYANVNSSQTNYDYVLASLFSYDHKTNESTSSIIINDLLSVNALKDQIYFELTGRLCMLIFSLIFLIVFLVTMLRKCDNYANDGFKFGRDFFAEKNLHKKPFKLDVLELEGVQESDPSESQSSRTCNSSLSSISSTKKVFI